MAGIWAARATAGQRRIVVLDGAKKLGAKILVAGGGRCNVTHAEVDARDEVKNSLLIGSDQTLRVFKTLRVYLFWTND